MKMIQRLITTCLASAALLALQACHGILPGIYDEPPQEKDHTVAGELYIDASDWQRWHFIDLKAVADSVAADSLYNTSAAWVSMRIPAPDAEPSESLPESECPGIYTYWYDVYGAGISVNEFCTFAPSAPQPIPEKWTFAVHRNNVMTNGGEVAKTSFSSLADIPDDLSFVDGLSFEGDTWNQTDVWTIQDRMLLGLIGNQGIRINNLLSSWLRVDVPPMPPAFTLDSSVFILRLSDGSMAALQLADYQSATGTKCCLTIRYRYPL